MSKKTRKKSSKGSAKTPGPKDGHGEGGPRRLKSLGQNARGKSPQGGRKEIRQSGQNRRGQSIP